MAFKILATAALFFSATAVAQSNTLTGTAQLLVLNATGKAFNTVTLADRIGCVNAEGGLTVDDCGLFTVVGNGLTSTTAGLCDFNDASQPKNVDSKYPIGYALICHTPNTDGANSWYTLGNNTVCQGDLDCYIDIQRAAVGDEVLPIWAYYWGSEQFGITPGHTQGALYWNQVSS